MAQLQSKEAAQVAVFGRQGETILQQISEQVTAAQKKNIGTLQREMDRTVAEMQQSVIKYAAEIKATIAEVQYILSFLTSNMLMLLAYSYADA